MTPNGVLGIKRNHDLYGLTPAWLALLLSCSRATCGGKAAEATTLAPVTSAVASSNDQQRCRRGDSEPSREGFFLEVLFPEASTRTPRFDDYTAGSYHIDKMDLARGLPGQAALCGVRLKALLIVGPVGLLWSYHVAAMIEQGPNVQVNGLVMPHARITGKGMGVLPMDEASSLLEAVRQSSAMRSGLPPEVHGDAGAEFSYRLLLVFYDQGEPKYSYADFNEFEQDSEVVSLLERVNALLGTTKIETYRHGGGAH